MAHQNNSKRSPRRKREHRERDRRRKRSCRERDRRYSWEFHPRGGKREIDSRDRLRAARDAEEDAWKTAWEADEDYEEAA